MRIGLVIASTLLTISCNAAQEDAADQSPAATDLSADAATGGIDASEVPQDQPVTSSTFVRFAAMSDLFEIETGKLAMKNGQSSATREFAKMMVEDHSASSRALKDAVEQAEITVLLPTKLDLAHQGRLDRLAKANVEDFDREYMNQQIEGHRDALKLHQEFQAAADDGTLVAFSQKVLPVIQKHYDQLEQSSAAENRSMTGSIKQ